jgi:hypothetical protein
MAMRWTTLEGGTPTGTSTVTVASAAGSLQATTTLTLSVQEPSCWLPNAQSCLPQPPSSLIWSTRAREAKAWLLKEDFGES